MNRTRKHVSDMFAWLLEMRWLDARISLALASYTTIPIREIDPNVRYERGMAFPVGDIKYLLEQDRHLDPSQPLHEQGCQVFLDASPRDWIDGEFCICGTPEGKTEEVIWKRYDNGVLYRLKSPNQGQRWRIYDGRTSPSQSNEWELDSE